MEIIEKFFVPVLTSTVFSGIIIAYFRQLFYKKNKQLEQTLSLELKKQELALNHNVEKSNVQFKFVFESYTNLWREMTEIEKYVIIKLPRELEDGSFDVNFTQVRNAYHEFRKNMIFLPDGLYREMNDLWDIISQDLTEFLQSINEQAQKVTLNQEGKRLVTEGAIKESVVASLRHFQNKFSLRMDELRKIFRREMVSLIPQDLKED